MAYLLGTYLLQRLVILTTASISDVWWVAFHGFEEDELKLAFHCSSGGGWEGGCDFVWFGIFLQCNLLATQEDQHNGQLMDLHEILVTMIVSLFGLSSLLFLKRFGMLSIPFFKITFFTIDSALAKTRSFAVTSSLQIMSQAWPISIKAHSHH